MQRDVVIIGAGVIDAAASLIAARAGVCVQVLDRLLAAGCMAVGTSGKQFKNAPMAGEMMAALIVEAEEGRDHNRDPVQYLPKHLDRTLLDRTLLDRTLPLGFLGCRGEVHPNSGFSVLG